MYVDPTLECVALTDCIVIIIFIANFLVFLILFIFGKLANRVGRQAEERVRGTKAFLECSVFFHGSFFG